MRKPPSVILSDDEVTVLLWFGRKLKSRRAAGVPGSRFDPADYRHAYALPDERFWAAAVSLEEKGLLDAEYQCFGYADYMGGGSHSEWHELGLTEAGELQRGRLRPW